MVRILVADDQELFRYSMNDILSDVEGIEIAGTVSNIAEAFGSLSQNKPDVVLVNMRKQAYSTADAARMIRDSYPDVKVIVLANSEDDEYIIDALKNGASGCILMNSSKAQFIEAVNIAISGGTMIPPKVATKVMRHLAGIGKNWEETDIDEKALAQFNDSEIRIIRAVGQGLSNKEIASSLFLSEGTIRNYISGILLKLQLRDKTQLAIWAVRNGMTK